VKNVADSRPLALYLALVFVGFWGCLALGYVDRLRFWVPILGAFAPATAAFIVVGFGQGEPVARDLMRRLFAWRVHRAWYLAAIGIPVVQNLCAVGPTMCGSAPTPPWRCTSATLTVRGSEEATKTPTASSVNTSRARTTSAYTVPLA
jgi:hypothetical protein